MGTMAPTENLAFSSNAIAMNATAGIDAPGRPVLENPTLSAAPAPNQNDTQEKSDNGSSTPFFGSSDRPRGCVPPSPAPLHPP